MYHLGNLRAITKSLIAMAASVPTQILALILRVRLKTSDLRGIFKEQGITDYPGGI